jgi:predicted dehydrogenase
MEPKKIKIAVVGCGGVCRWGHMPAYKAMKNAEVVAVCDIKPEKAESIAKEYNIPKTYTDYKEMLAAEKPDAVDLCVPNYLTRSSPFMRLNTVFTSFPKNPMQFRSKRF